jgi:hypothetical protein
MRTDQILYWPGTMNADGDFRAPIFYDSNDTGYYLDPNGFSNLNRANFIAQGSDATSSIYIGGQNVTTSGSLWINFHSDGDPNYRMGKPAGAWTQPLEFRFYTGQRFRASPAYGGFQFINIENSAVLFDIGNGSAFARSNVNFYAPIMYDNNDSGYYVDPNSASRLASLLVTGGVTVGSGATASYLYMADSDEGERILHCNSNRIGFLTQAGGWGSWCDDSGYWLSEYSVRAPVFYDSNNTGYYLDPAGGSFLSSVTFDNLITGRSSGSTDVNTANDTGSMSIRGSTTTVASVSFHRTGAYAINMGLGTDNVFRIGGWSATANAFQMDGSGNLTMTGNVTAYSDARLKKDVETISGALDLVGKMRGVTYTRIDTGEAGVGVIAQEMLEVMPQVVQQGIGDNDTLSVAYGNLVGVLIEAIKELTARVAELEGK